MGESLEIRVTTYVHITTSNYYWYLQVKVIRWRTQKQCFRKTIMSGATIYQICDILLWVIHILIHIPIQVSVYQLNHTMVASATLVENVVRERWLALFPGSPRMQTKNRKERVLPLFCTASDGKLGMGAGNEAKRWQCLGQIKEQNGMTGLVRSVCQGDRGSTQLGGQLCVSIVALLPALHHRYSYCKRR